MKAVICAIAKCENKYINEWVNYHLALGFDHIYIHDNNDSTTPYVGNFIENKDKVTIIDVRDIHKHFFQDEVYTTFYNKYKDTFDWCAYIDIDEFIELKDCHNIKEFLAQDKYKDFEVIRMKWHLYGDDGFIERDERIPVHKFFKNHLKDVSKANQAKSIVRGSLDGVQFNSSHYPSRGNYVLKQCLTDGSLTKMKISYESEMNEFAWVNHYMTKTLKEFLEQKYSRTDCQFEEVRLSLDYYWNVNKITSEKIEYINNFFRQRNINTKAKESDRFISTIKRARK